MKSKRPPRRRRSRAGSAGGTRRGGGCVGRDATVPVLRAEPFSKYFADAACRRHAVDAVDLVDAGRGATVSALVDRSDASSRSVRPDRRRAPRAASSRSCTAPRRSSTAALQPRSAPSPRARQRRQHHLSRRNAKCCGSRKKPCGWSRSRRAARSARRRTVSSLQACVRYSLNVPTAALPQPLLQPRRHQRPLALVQRDAALLVDQADDRRQVAIAIIGIELSAQAGVAHRVTSDGAVRAAPSAAEHAIEIEQDLDACP